MLKLVTISLASLRTKDAVFVIFVTNVLKQMKNNPNYTTPTPTLAVVQTALDNFNTALIAKQTGGKLQTTLKNAARAALVTIMRALGGYVQLNCQNDLAILQSSGFEARKTPTRAGNLPAPTNVTFTTTDVSGRMAVRCARVNNAKSYWAQTSTDISSEDNWEDEGAFSSTRISLDGMQPGTIVWMRLCAVGAKGAGAWSTPISAMAV